MNKPRELIWTLEGQINQHNEIVLAKPLDSTRRYPWLNNDETLEVIEMSAYLEIQRKLSVAKLALKKYMFIKQTDPTTGELFDLGLIARQALKELDLE